MKKSNVKWLKEPQKHDYPAAESYLSLILEPQAAKTLAEQLESAKMTELAAKDIFRASGVSLLGIGNSHVEKDRARIILNEELSRQLHTLQHRVRVWRIGIMQRPVHGTEQQTTESLED